MVMLVPVVGRDWTDAIVNVKSTACLLKDASTDSRSASGERE